MCSDKGIKKTPPSVDEWLKEAKTCPEFSQEGMFLIHNGVVRQTPKAYARLGLGGDLRVKAMEFSYDSAKVDAAVAKARGKNGIFHVRAWLNEGRLDVGDDIMYVLVGGDIRPHVIEALQSLVEELKTDCVTETELSS